MKAIRHASFLSAAFYVFFAASAWSPALARELSFGDRVAAQKAIEQVYWNHRIWPKENPGSKPSLSEVMSDGAIRAKVADYLRMSMLLDSFWHKPVSAEQLQAEVTRIAKHTEAPEILREIFAALHDDPFVIAECLARPVLVQRLVEAAFSGDERIHGAQRRALASKLNGVTDIAALERLDGDRTETILVLNDGAASATLPEDPTDRSIHLDRDGWEREIRPLANAFGNTPVDSFSAIPVDRVSRIVDRGDQFMAFAVRSKDATSITFTSVSEQKRGYQEWSLEAAGSSSLAVRANAPLDWSYTTPEIPLSGCTDDTWAASSMTTGSGANVPAARYGHTAVWTGSEMIVWGGNGVGGYLNTGGRYNPATDSWSASSLTTGSGASVPSPRDRHASIWTGTEMIVWGGALVGTGGRYNPATDSWASSALTTGSGDNVPAARFSPTAVWTGSEMIVWGGVSNATGLPVNTGGRYNPITDSWSSSSLNTGSGANVPSARYLHTAILSGTEMIVWGGSGPGGFLSTGGRYNTATDSWATSSLTTGSGANVAVGRASHTAVWTGSEMIVWGGYSGSANLNTGGRYNPATDSWATSSLTTGSGANVPVAREYHTAVYTGSEMIIWGGNGSADLNTGGRFNPATDSWASSSLSVGSGSNVPSGRSWHSAVWAGSEMIVWGGLGAAAKKSGGRYCASGPANDNCDTPTVLTLNRVVKGTTVNANNDYLSAANSSCFSGVGQNPTSAAGRDVVFSFTAPVAGKYSFRYVQDDGAAALRSQDPVLYLSGSCPASAPSGPAVPCIAGANRITANGASNGNRSEEIDCVALTASQQVFLFFDDGSATNPGGPMAVEVTKCFSETEPNDNLTAATPVPGCFTTGSASTAGDVDFFGLGAPPAGSKIFAGVDAVAANDGDFEMRITNATATLGYDDNDGTSQISANAPVIAGVIADGSETYVRINTRSVASGPFHFYTRVETGAPQDEIDTPENYSWYYGNVITSGGFVRGVHATASDGDCFRFVANDGDNIVMFSDNNPSRLSGSIVNTWPILYDLVGGPPTAVRFTGQVLRNIVTQSPGTLTGVTPSVTSEFWDYRARYTGSYMVCYYPDSPAAGYPFPYQGSISLNCGPIPAPASRITDVSINQAGEIGPGSAIIYTITLSNTGNDIAQDVQMLDTLPPGLVFVGLAVNDGFSGNNVGCISLPHAGTADAPIDCTNFSIAPGASTTYTLSAQVASCVSAGAIVSNMAAITTLSTDPNSANDVATWNFTPSLDSLCGDDNECTIETCSPATGCMHTAVDCNDNNLCTDDSCDFTTGCTHTNNYAACNSGDVCTSGDFCSGGTCHPGTLIACGDGNVCTADSCNSATGCVHINSCDDGNACTDDSCNPTNGCVHTNNTASCTDGNPCTLGDVCAAGTCHAGPPSSPNAVFGQTIIPQGKVAFVWATAANIEFVKGALSSLNGYGIWIRDSRAGTTTLDISQDLPAAGEGVFYLIRTASDPGLCTSWQSDLGSEPARDTRIYPSCDVTQPSSDQLTTAVDAAMVGLDDPLHDNAQYMTLLSRVQDQLHCVLTPDPPSVYESSLAATDCDTTYCPNVNYCGPGNSSHGSSWLLPKVGPCLNQICFNHDNCYSADCIQCRACYWSNQTTLCDRPFLASQSTCVASDGQFGRVDSLVYATAAAATRSGRNSCQNAPCHGLDDCGNTEQGECNHGSCTSAWAAQVYNADHDMKIKLNGTVVGTSAFCGGGVFVHLNTSSGLNTLEIILNNDSGLSSDDTTAATWGYKIYKDGMIVRSSECGVACTMGCNNNAPFPIGLVFDQIYTIQGTSITP